MVIPDQAVAVRAFIRNFNILVKQAGMYGLQHQRSAAQLELTGKELRRALERLPVLHLGLAGDRLLLNGAQLPHPGPAERTLVQFFFAAGVAGIQFRAALTAEEFADFVNRCATVKPSELLAQLKSGLHCGDHIQVMEPQFMVAGTAPAPAAGPGMAGAITSLAMDGQARELEPWLNDPAKLLQLISVAAGGTAEAAGNAAAPSTQPPGERDVRAAIEWLARVGKKNGAMGSEPAPRATRELLQEAIAAVANDPSESAARTPLLVRLAEDMAVRYALQTYEGDAGRIGAVRAMLQRVGQTTEQLRKLLGCHEEAMRRAGLPVETHQDVLDRQFWAGVPERNKRQLLLSPDAWCIPAKNVANYVGEVLQSGDGATAQAVLRNYCGLLESAEAEAPERVAAGLPELADELKSTGLLRPTIAALGRKLAREAAPDADNRFAAALARLSNLAAAAGDYGAVRAAYATVRDLPEGVASTVRRQIGIEEHAGELVARSAGADADASEAIEVLQEIPEAAARELLKRFQLCTDRAPAERIAALLAELGAGAAEVLRQRFRTGAAEDIIEVAGLLSRVDAGLMEERLPLVVGSWEWLQQHALVQAIAAGGAPERGRLLAGLLGVFHPLALPGALDEIGLSGQLADSAQLVELARGGPLAGGSGFLQVKAIEALGRLGEKSAEPALARLVTARRTLGWEHPRELRIAAAQALLALQPHARQLVSDSGLNPEDLRLAPLDAAPAARWRRQRRYERIEPERSVLGIARPNGGECRIAIGRINLGGGLGTTTMRMGKPTEAGLELQVGFRCARCHVVLNELRPHQVGFEIVEIELEQRAKLRRFLSQQPPHARVCRNAQPDGTSEI